jgi:predicted Zn-ribbon and HTH transcriptional regulator
METVRQRIEALLRERECSSREISARLGIPEKDVPAHLDHVARGLAARAGRMAVRPAECKACGFLFEGRRRFTKPGRCPRCRGERVEAPSFHIRD